MMAAALLHWSITHLPARSDLCRFCSFKWALEMAVFFILFYFAALILEEQTLLLLLLLKWLLAKAKTFWLQLKVGEIVYTLSFYNRYQFS